MCASVRSTNGISRIRRTERERYLFGTFVSLAPKRRKENITRVAWVSTAFTKNPYFPLDRSTHPERVSLLLHANVSEYNILVKDLIVLWRCLVYRDIQITSHRCVILWITFVVQVYHESNRVLDLRRRYVMAMVVPKIIIDRMVIVINYCYPASSGAYRRAILYNRHLRTLYLKPRLKQNNKKKPF